MLEGSGDALSDGVTEGSGDGDALGLADGATLALTLECTCGHITWEPT